MISNVNVIFVFRHQVHHLVVLVNHNFFLNEWMQKNYILKNFEIEILVAMGALGDSFYEYLLKVLDFFVIFPLFFSEKLTFFFSRRNEQVWLLGSRRSNVLVYYININWLLLFENMFWCIILYYINLNNNNNILIDLFILFSDRLTKLVQV